MPTFEESLAAGGRMVGEARRDPIEVVPWDPAWALRFEEMRAGLARALGPVALRIDHVGSTAIPGIPAKPIVDIQVSVADVEDDDAYRGAIESQGFGLRYIEPGHRYFRPPPELPREHQIHVCSIGSEWERVHLLFRDYLLAHSDVAAEYGRLKQRIAERLRHQRITYNDEKAPFIDATIAAAEQWAAATGWRP